MGFASKQSSIFECPPPVEGLGVARTAIECAPWGLAREKPVTRAEPRKKDVLSGERQRLKRAR